MKILSLHCDYIKFKAVKKAIKNPEELSEDMKKEKKIEEALVIFTAVEQGDSLELVQKLIENIKDIASQVKAKNIVLYPYAHLSSNLSAPEVAESVLKQAEVDLKKDKSYSVTRAPFGYYKEFELKCKGHPLAELSRSISLVEGEKGKIKVEEKEITDDMRKRMLREISRVKLDTSKLKDNDHRIIGMNMDLWSFNEVAPGMAFWHNKGLTIYNELVKYWREEHFKNGYTEVSTPQIMDRKLWEISGHWKLYKENIFATKYEGRDFAVKPMNCPGGMLLYRIRPRSYKELPMRVGELGIVHRQELSGTLAGLFRVIKFTQDDAHIFCTKEQLESEIMNVIELFQNMLGKFGFKDYKFTLSVRSEEKKDKYLGDDALWEKAEETLEKALKKLGLKFERNEGEAKFYGPSLDVAIKDSLGREWQCSTLQLDFNTPGRFELTYTDENNQEKTPIMLHRVVYGSIDRFIGVLTEHLNGNFPLWLSPNQVKVMTLTDRNVEFAEIIYEKLREAGIRTEIDSRSETMDKKVRDAQLEKFNYMLTIGDKEEENNTIAVRARDGKVKFGIKLDDFTRDLKKEIEERK